MGALLLTFEPPWQLLGNHSRIAVAVDDHRPLPGTPWLSMGCPRLWDGHCSRFATQGPLLGAPAWTGVISGSSQGVSNRSVGMWVVVVRSQASQVHGASTMLPTPWMSFCRKIRNIYLTLVGIRVLTTLVGSLLPTFAWMSAVFSDSTLP